MTAYPSVLLVCDSDRCGAEYDSDDPTTASARRTAREFYGWSYDSETDRDLCEDHTWDKK